MTPPIIGPDAFRRLLGAFASGVTVVTTRDPDGAPAGMTASAFSSVSLDPPLVLVCIANDSGLHDVLRAAPRFAVNVLADDQAALSVRFAGARSQRFTGVAIAETGGESPPLLGGAAAYLVCETTAVHPGGDHAIFVARVVAGESFDRPPLLHFRGEYRQLAE